MARPDPPADHPGLGIHPVSDAIGARVDAGDIGHLDDAGVHELRRAVCDHLVVIIAGQDLTAAELAGFTRRLGPPGDTPFIATCDEHGDVIRVLKEASDGEAFNFGGAWHSDFSFQPAPPSFTVLHAVDVPTSGGDTLWSSMVAAYDALDDGTADRLAGITAIHTAADAYSPRMQPLHSGLSSMTIICDDTADARQRHPLVTTHPETGRRALFFNQAYVRDLEGMDGAEVADTLAWLHTHTTDGRFTWRHQWSNGDVAIWDNRATQHYAVNDYAGQRRELLRSTVAGTPPLAG